LSLRDCCADAVSLSSFGGEGEGFADVDIVNQTQWKGGALRRPRRVQRRSGRFDSHVIRHWFSPLNAGWDGAARRPHLMLVVSKYAGVGTPKMPSFSLFSFV
jgi:hypothetical protein